MNTIITAKAQCSAVRLNLSQADLSYIFENGYYIEHEEQRYVLLRACDVPPEEHKRDKYTRLIGIKLILSPNRQLISGIERSQNHKSYREPYRRHGRRLGLLLAA